MHVYIQISRILVAHSITIFLIIMFTPRQCKQSRPLPTNHGQDEDEVAEVVEEVREQCVVAAAAALLETNTLVSAMTGNTSSNGREFSTSATRQPVASSNADRAIVSVKVKASAGYCYCTSAEFGTRVDTTSIGKPARTASTDNPDVPVAVHVEFYGVITRNQLESQEEQPVDAERIDSCHNMRKLAVAVAGCEAARSALSNRTFDGRQLLAVFALEPTRIALRQ